MASIFELLERRWAEVKPARWVILVVAIAAAGAGWWFADYHYQADIAVLKDTLQNKEFPKPQIKTQYVPVPDHSQAQEFSALGQKLDSIIGILGKRPPQVVVSRPSHTESQSAPVSANQSGGVAQGAGSSIQTVNQNGLPARSAFAAPLGALYTEGYLILQATSVKGLSDPKLDDIDKRIGAWRSKVITWMNANMCPDAAAYFLKAHRGGMDYGLGERQDKIYDVQSWSLDNLSDIKRNDAWDCK